MPDQADEHKPTIDERLEALAQAVELMASMQQDSNRRIDRMSDKVDRMADKVDKTADAIDTLGRIPGLHEQRFDETEMSLDAIINRLQRIERERRPLQA